MVVARKNVRDFRNVVINPRDHLVLPDKRRLSRNDVSELLSNQQFWIDNPHMRSLIPQLLEYMVSPYKGKPTVVNKVRGGGLWQEVYRQVDADYPDDAPMPDLEPFAGNPTLASRLTDHYARRTPTHLHPQRDPTANTPPYLRNNQNNISSVAPPHAAGTSNDPGEPFLFAPLPSDHPPVTALPLRPAHRRELRKVRQMDKQDLERMQIHNRAARRAVMQKGRRDNAKPAASNDPAPVEGSSFRAMLQKIRELNTADESLNAKPAASTRKPRKNDVAGVEESKNDGTFVPPAAPPVMPIPPVSAPTAPPVQGAVSSLSWLMDEAFRQNRTGIIKKLYPLMASKKAHTLPLVDLVKVAGLSEDEFVALTDLHRAGNVLNFPVSDNSGISSNGIKVNHVHGEQFGPRSNPARPLVIRTNAGTAKIKSFA